MVNIYRFVLLEEYKLIQLHTSFCNECIFMKPIKLFPVIFINLADKPNILSIEEVGLLQYKLTSEMLDFLSFMKKTSSLRALGVAHYHNYTTRLQPLCVP